MNEQKDAEAVVRGLGRTYMGWLDTDPTMTPAGDFTATGTTTFSSTVMGMSIEDATITAGIIEAP